MQVGTSGLVVVDRACEGSHGRLRSTFIDISLAAGVSLSVGEPGGLGLGEAHSRRLSGRIVKRRRTSLSMRLSATTSLCSSQPSIPIVEFWSQARTVKGSVMTGGFIRGAAFAGVAAAGSPVAPKAT